MADINLDKGKTMLLMADFSTSGIEQNPVAQERQTLERARDVLDAARNAGVFVGYCSSHFRPGFPEVSDRNTTRAARRDSGEVLPADPTTMNAAAGPTPSPARPGVPGWSRGPDNRCPQSRSGRAVRAP
jgi:hypothetical protein